MKNRIPRKLKKQVKKRERIKKALESIGIACAAVASVMQAFRVALAPKFPIGGIVHNSDGGEPILPKRQ